MFNLIGSGLINSKKKAIITPSDPTVKALFHFDSDFSDVKGNTVNLIGSPTLSTAQSKFGGSSFYADSTSHRIEIPSTENLALGTENFIFEFFCYAVTTAQKNFNVLDTNNLSSDIFFYTRDNNINLFYGGTKITTPCPSGQQNYVALTREGGLIKLYVNGVKASTDYNFGTGSLGTATKLTIGTTFGNNIYIDELRLSIGSIQTPTVVPTAPFPD